MSRGETRSPGESQFKTDNTAMVVFRSELFQVVPNTQKSSRL